VRNRSKIYVRLLTIVIITISLCNSCKPEDEQKLSSGLSYSKESLTELYDEIDSLYTAKDYSPALNKALNLLEKAESSGENGIITDTQYLIGKIWHQSKSYKKAISYFQQSLEGFKNQIEINDSLNESSVKLNNNYQYLENNFNIGKSYHRLFDTRLWDKDSIIKETYKDSTLFFYGKVTNSSSVEDNIEILKSKVYNNLSGFYMRDNALEKAEEYARKSIEIKERKGDQYLIATGYNTLSNIHFLKKDYNAAKKALLKGIEALEKVTGEEADEINAGLYYNLAYSMYLLKDYKAYDIQEKSYEISNQLNEKFNEKKIAEIYANKNFESGYKEAKLEEEIIRQKVIYQKKNAQKTAWIIGICSLFVIILLVILLKQYKLRQKNLGLELSKQELIQQQKLEKIKNESQIRILNATLDGKESERKQIAETLHDSVSALLSSANLHLQACKTQFNGNTPVEVHKSQSIINEASQKIRDLSHTLVSSILLKFGLSFAIKDIAEKFSNSELKIDHETRYIKRYDLGFEIKLYNIIQEFINNILKHSQASYAKITLVEKNKKIILVIEDNGQGFDKETIPEKDGLGINQIDARIQMMKGKFTIESGKGKGTKITIELPVFEKEPVTTS
jgi:signal transduction histidine kinase